MAKKKKNMMWIAGIGIAVLVLVLISSPNFQEASFGINLPCTLTSDGKEICELKFASCHSGIATQGYDIAAWSFKDVTSCSIQVTDTTYYSSGTCTITTSGSQGAKLYLSSSGKTKCQSFGSSEVYIYNNQKFGTLTLQHSSTPVCINDCILGNRQCLSTGNLRVCGNYDSDSCFEWSELSCKYGCETSTNQCKTDCTQTGCPINYACNTATGACYLQSSGDQVSKPIPVCPSNGCSQLGLKRCTTDSTGVDSCEAPRGCLEWRPLQVCQYGCNEATCNSVSAEPSTTIPSATTTTIISDGGQIISPFGCGNNLCEVGETSQSCPKDCGLPVEKTTTTMKEKGSSELGDQEKVMMLLIVVLVGVVIVAAVIKKRKKR